ncbi:MAG: hypothetical protein AAFX09_01855 [Pseudomonadota bacterium]
MLKRCQVVIASILVALLLGACTSTVRETHYFASYEPGDTEPANFFRLTVKADSGFTSSRYLAGYYDERAVDLFFNEIRTRTGTEATPDRRNIFTGLPQVAGSTIKPLQPTPENGAFVMIFSTNADSVANTIGSFAESQVVADAITNLVNRDTLRAAARSDAMTATVMARASFVNDTFQTSADQILAAVGQDAATTNWGALERSSLRALESLARGLGADESFASFDEARTWFNAHRTAGDRES